MSVRSAQIVCLIDVCCSVLQCAAVSFSVLQCAAMCCRVLQCVAVCCSVLQCAITPDCMHDRHECNTLQHTATHCNILQHTAMHCITLQHTATHPLAECYADRRDMTHGLYIHIDSRREPIAAMSVHSVQITCLIEVKYCSLIYVCRSVLQCIAVRWNASHGLYA